MRPLALALLAALAAGPALQRLARYLFPPLGVPTSYVTQPYGVMGPGQMEDCITYRYEYHVLCIAWISHEESKSIRGA